MLSTEVRFCLRITYQMTKKHLQSNLHLLSMQKVEVIRNKTKENFYHHPAKNSQYKSHYKIDSIIYMKGKEIKYQNMILSIHSI